MKELTIYALEVLACGGGLLGVYAILLERRVKSRWCRAYLLTSTLLSAVIPLLRIPVWPGEVITAMPVVPTSTWEVVTETVSPVLFITPETICIFVYLLGVTLIAGLMIWQVVRIHRLRRHALITQTANFTLVRTPYKIASFSFFRTIYVWDQTPTDEMTAIAAHESSHITHHHSAERIVMECMKAALWWNPFVWIAARRLTEAEEFEADSDVLQSGYDIEIYMNTLFKQLFGYSPDIANGLRNSLTKKRFQMMTKPTTSRHALLRLAATLPTVIGLLCAFSFTTRAAVVVTTEDSDPQEELQSIFLLNGKEVPPETIRELDPKQITYHKSFMDNEIPAEFKDRNAHFVHHFTTDGTPRKGEKITIQGQARFPDGRPAKGISIYAGIPFTQPINVAEQQKICVRTDADGRYRIKGPTSGILAYSHDDYSAGLKGYDSKGANPFTQDIEITFPDSAKWESTVDAKGEVVLLPKQKAGYDESGETQVTIRTPQQARQGAANTPASGELKTISVRVILMDKDGKSFSSDNTAPGVIVKEVGSDLGVVTDTQGKATIKAKPGTVLEVIYIGYQPSSILVDDQTGYIVILRPEGKAQEEGAFYTRDTDGVKQTPLYIVDGVEQPAITELDASAIESLSVLKEKTATDLYGERGRDGVILITTNSKAKKLTQNDDTPFLVAETMPLFQEGNLNLFRQWVQARIKYPAKALAEGIHGRVVLSFIIEKDGSVSNITMLQSPDKLLSDEARRVVESSPAWTPGKQRGEAVRVKYTLPVDFAVQTNDN